MDREDIHFLFRAFEFWVLYLKRAKAGSAWSNDLALAQKPYGPKSPSQTIWTTPTIHI